MTCKHNWHTLTASANGRTITSTLWKTFTIVLCVRPSCTFLLERQKTR